MELLRRSIRERDGFHTVALLNLIDHIHAGNDAAENGVLGVERWLRLEANIELAAARRASGIDLIASARRRYAAAQMLLGRGDFGRDGIAGAAHSGAVGVAALHHEVGDHAMKRQSVVET